MTNSNQLSRWVRYSFGLGHIQNDICASLWYTYFLLYIHVVLEFDSFYSGIIIFIGQIADAVATMFVGYFSDQGDEYWLCRVFGSRKSWHMFGTVCVLLPFTFLFLPCLACDATDGLLPEQINQMELSKTIYYSGFVIIFHIGWAAVQNSHLSMIPELTSSSDQRTSLTAIRNAATAISNIIVYLVAWAFLGLGGSVSKQDVIPFRNIVLVSLAIGAISSILFYILVPGTKKPTPSPSPTPSVNNVPIVERRTPRMTNLKWFIQPQFYQVAVVYLCARLFANLSRSYIALYLQVTLKLPAKYVTIIPLVMYASGFIISLVVNKTKTTIGRKPWYAMGCIFGIIGCLWVYFGHDSDEAFLTQQIFGIGVFLGMACSVVVVGCLTLTADFIGPDSESSAFVFGMMSFIGKISNGIAVVIIQSFTPDTKSPDYPHFFEMALIWSTGGVALVGLIGVISLMPLRIDRRWGISEAESSVEDANERSPLIVDQPDEVRD